MLFCLNLPEIELHIINKKGLTVIRLDVCSFDSESCKSFLNVKMRVYFSKFITVDGPVTFTLGCDALSFSLFFNSLPTHLLHYSVLFIYSFNTFFFFLQSILGVGVLDETLGISVNQRDKTPHPCWQTWTS